MKHPDEAARVFEKRPAADAQSFLTDLPPNVVAGVLSQTSLAASAEILSLLNPDHAAAVTSELPRGSAASLLRRIDPSLRSKLLAALSEDLRDQLNRLLTYPDGTVGAATDPEVLAIPDDLTVDEAQRLLRSRKATVHHQLYVVDRSRRLIGYLHVRDLVRASPKAAITSVMRPAAVQIQASARLASSISHPAWRELDAIPVVDNGGVLLGILRHRQLRRLQSSQASGELAETLFSLSELCWMGLSSMILPTAKVERLRGRRPGSESGESHGS
jgi:magnesium transporter